MWCFLYETLEDQEQKWSLSLLFLLNSEMMMSFVAMYNCFFFLFSPLPLSHGPPNSMNSMKLELTFKPLLSIEVKIHNRYVYRYTRNRELSIPFYTNWLFFPSRLSKWLDHKMQLPITFKMFKVLDFLTDNSAQLWINFTDNFSFPFSFAIEQ